MTPDVTMLITHPAGRPGRLTERIIMDTMRALTAQLAGVWQKHRISDRAWVITGYDAAAAESDRSLRYFGAVARAIAREETGNATVKVKTAETGSIARLLRPTETKVTLHLRRPLSEGWRIDALRQLRQLRPNTIITFGPVGSATPTLSIYAPIDDLGGERGVRALVKAAVALPAVQDDRNITVHKPLLSPDGIASVLDDVTTAGKWVVGALVALAVYSLVK